jgi:gliding-associated putative ABC transporter substrate-binding component GldG
MVAWEQKRTSDVLMLLNGVMLAIVLSQVASIFYFRWDLTEEGRYTIKEPTIVLLQSLEDDVYVDVFLEGDLNAEFRRLRKAIRETLEEFRVYSGNKLHYRFSDPMAAAGANAQREFMSDLVAKGIKPINIIDSKDGRRSEKIVFPGALISFGGQQTGVMLLKDQVGQGAQEDLNRAIEGLEFELANAVHQLTVTSRKQIGFVFGHGELDSLQVTSLREGLNALYDVNLRVRLSKRISREEFGALIIAKPQRKFSEQEKYNLDQYVMGGGKVIFLVDALRADMDSVARGDYYSFPYALGLEDMLFQYGIRINQDFVQDLVSLRYPIVTGVQNGKPQITPIEWPYFPLANHYASHPATRNLDATAFRFANSLDTVKATGIRKTPLTFSSQYTRRVTAPLKINVNDLRKEIKPENFSAGPLPMAYLLEGRFTSLYKNRFLPEGVDSSGNKVYGEPSQLMVVADGDLARNEINRRTGQPLELGFDAVSNHTFANRELLLNMIAYLTDDSGLITARNREIVMRPLDKEKIRSSRVTLQIINLGLPFVLLLILGVTKAFIRRRRYGQFATPLSDGRKPE